MLPCRGREAAVPAGSGRLPLPVRGPCPTKQGAGGAGVGSRSSRGCMHFCRELQHVDSAVLFVQAAAGGLTAAGL
jgi:hypothetical protein